MDPQHLFGLVIVVVLIAIFVISKNRQPAVGWRHKLSEVTGIGKDPPDEAEIHRLVQEINIGVA